MALYAPFHLIFTKAREGDWYHHPHLTDGNTELAEVINRAQGSGTTGLHIRVDGVGNHQWHLNFPGPRSLLQEEPLLPTPAPASSPGGGGGELLMHFPKPQPLSDLPKPPHKTLALPHAISYGTDRLAVLRGALFPSGFPSALWGRK